MALSKRLEQVLHMIPRCRTVADVGTDHGYLAVACIETEVAQRVIAIDVNQGPLESANGFVKERKLEQSIECRLGDGLGATKQGEVDCAVICGMGGELMQHIITVGPELLETYVLQPQSHRRELKQFLVDQGYGIVQEECLLEGNQYYDMWLVQRGVISVYDELPKESVLWEYGALLQREQSEVWKQHIQRRIKTLQSIVQHMRNTTKSNDVVETMEQELQALQGILQ
ncbi:class I SAM-dependent methyltransferase [Veillonella sp. VA139]|uniref:tRNA (adenine(22)-N(1))-methyltransferase n=1 Tax=Veillonella sp. VA139 TaxID=741830 RepID=UPI000F8EC8F7|nr:class I SAM-dependent methyltransferase [Veillonella sp. VA139]